MRKYSVDEIDRMRVAVGMLHEGLVIRWLKLYMVNGTEPEELERSAEAARLKREEEDKRYREALQPRPCLKMPWPA